RRSTYDSGRHLGVSWSPDGSRLVFQTNRDGNWEIVVTGIDGDLARLTDSPADDLNPTWSPDGARIAFSSNRAGWQNISLCSRMAARLRNSPASPLTTRTPPGRPMATELPLSATATAIARFMSWIGMAAIRLG